jgi:two-component system sensor histidine kinase BaeS
LAVADTGAGIDAADLPHVFDRFWRGDRSRTRETGGIGLGLPIARRLVEAHGGTIHVASEEGMGTTFTIFLPQREPHVN